jgi:hypothetical protein
MFSEKSPELKRQMQRLYQLSVYGRWSVVGILWLAIAPICLWQLRGELSLWRQYFTWTAVRYAIAYNRLPSLGLAFCIAITTAVLVWQSRNILLGLPTAEENRLRKQVLKITQQGRSHPLWRWVCE